LTHKFSILFEHQKQIRLRLVEPQPGSTQFPPLLVRGRIQLTNSLDPELGNFILCGGKRSLIEAQASG